MKRSISVILLGLTGMAMAATTTVASATTRSIPGMLCARYPNQSGAGVWRCPLVSDTDAGGGPYSALTITHAYVQYNMTAAGNLHRLDACAQSWSGGTAVCGNPQIPSAAQRGVGHHEVDIQNPFWNLPGISEWDFYYIALSYTADAQAGTQFQILGVDYSN
jgi:hypothetical protein